MKITSVTYRSLRTGRGYNNTAVEAHAEVGPDDKPEAVLAELRFWVDKQVDDTLSREDAYEKLDSIQQQLVWKQKEAADLDKHVAAQRQVIREHKQLVNLARENGAGGAALLLDNEIPF